MPLTVLGDVSDARFTNLAGMPVTDVLVLQEESACGRFAHTHDGLDQLSLAVTLDPGDAQHLTGVDGQADVVQDVANAGTGEGQAGNGEQRAVRDRGRILAGRGQLGADHQLGELAGGHRIRVDGGDRGATPDDGDRVGDRQHLVALVGDEDDRQSLTPVSYTHLTLPTIYSV